MRYTVSATHLNRQHWIFANQSSTAQLIVDGLRRTGPHSIEVQDNDRGCFVKMNEQDGTLQFPD